MHVSHALQKVHPEALNSPSLPHWSQVTSVLSLHRVLKPERVGTFICYCVGCFLILFCMMHGCPYQGKVTYIHMYADMYVQNVPHWSAVTRSLLRVLEPRGWIYLYVIVWAFPRRNRMYTILYGMSISKESHILV